MVFRKCHLGNKNFHQLPRLSGSTRSLRPLEIPGLLTQCPPLIFEAHPPVTLRIPVPNTTHSLVRTREESFLRESNCQGLVINAAKALEKDFIYEGAKHRIPSYCLHDGPYWWVVSSGWRKKMQIAKDLGPKP